MPSLECNTACNASVETWVHACRLPAFYWHMLATALLSVMTVARTQRQESRVVLPPLENGDMLTLNEFLRRYDDMHDVKKAELIEGIVHMPSPVRADAHAEPDGKSMAGCFAMQPNTA